MSWGALDVSLTLTFSAKGNIFDNIFQKQIQFKTAKLMEQIDNHVNACLDPDLQHHTGWVPDEYRMGTR